MSHQPNQLLMQQVVKELNNVNPELGEWISDNINEHGPWSCKSDTKEQVNCFLRYHLTQVQEDTSDLREYLTCEDEDDVWLGAVVNNVAPVLGRHALVV